MDTISKWGYNTKIGYRVLKQIYEIVRGSSYWAPINKALAINNSGLL